MRPCVADNDQEGRGEEYLSKAGVVEDFGILEKAEESHIDRNFPRS